jgi:cellulose synthase/poly-beta-1,6-N-acetylglucosamine synthase-like glycosyltransferase
MLDLLLVPVGILYLLVVGLLFIYGLNFFYLTWITWRYRREAAQPLPLQSLPRVTVQLPLYNEIYVADRLIRAAAGLDYPDHLLEIQVLDDSTDETRDLVKNLVDNLMESGINIAHLHRTNRAGYKAGALAAGFEQASGEFLAIFDADFIPPPDFLAKALPYFDEPRVAFVQTRWGHVNARFSFLTLIQSLAVDAHFMVEQFARSRGGFWFNFNGTGGIWRREAILDAGGWRAATLTEDLDLSYRAFLRGWQARYVREVVVPAELPASFSAYRRQQHRWARGSLECAQTLLPSIWKAQLPGLIKIEAVLHLTGYGVHILLAALAILYPLVLLLSMRYAGLLSLFGIATVFNATAFAPMLFFLVAQQQLGTRWWSKIPLIAFISAFGAGMMVNTLRAALHSVRRKDSVFERTPKFGIGNTKQDWTGRRYQLRLDPIVFAELAFAVFNLATMLIALKLHNWLISFYAMMFAMGLLFTSGMTLLQSINIRRHRKDSREDVLEQKGKNHDIPCLKPAFPAARTEAIEDAILKTVAYADIFDYPLSAAELSRYLIGISASQSELKSILKNGSVVWKYLRSSSGFVHLAGREEIVSLRHWRSRKAARLWPKAIRYGKMIAHLPFVRMVAVTGALAMDNVTKSGDMDFLIVTKPGRLWLCRAMVIALVRWAARFGDTLCPNYFLSSRALVFAERNLYSAHEVAQMIPLSGYEVYRDVRSLNNWSNIFLPNAQGMPGRAYHIRNRNGHTSSFHQFAQTSAESILRQPPLDFLERWEMNRKVHKFERLADVRAETAFAPDWCKGHFAGHSKSTLIAFQERMRALEKARITDPLKPSTFKP